MRHSLAGALLSVALALFAIPGCGGSATQDSATGGHAGSSIGGHPTTGGHATTGGDPTSGGRSSSGGGPTSGGQPRAGSGGTGGTDVCSLPQVSGPCDAYAPSFWHDPATDTCERFVYGGCEGNANRFPSLAACQAACGGKPSLEACDTSLDCALKSPGCCGGCEPVEMADLIAVNGTHLADDQCDVACGQCPQLAQGQHETRGYFVPACVEHECKVVDVRQTEMVSCSIDSDCRLRFGASCCEACGGEPIAVSTNANFCPDGALPCPACLPMIPPGYSSACVNGRCTLAAPPCTLAHPCP